MPTLQRTPIWSTTKEPDFGPQRCQLPWELQFDQPQKNNILDLKGAKTPKNSNLSLNIIATVAIAVDVTAALAVAVAVAVTAPVTIAVAVAILLFI